MPRVAPPQCSRGVGYVMGPCGQLRQRPQGQLYSTKEDLVSGRCERRESSLACRTCCNASASSGSWSNQGAAGLKSDDDIVRSSSPSLSSSTHHHHDDHSGNNSGHHSHGEGHNGHGHDHSHSHHHGHSHSHSHGHAHYSESAVSRALEKTGLVALGDRLSHSGIWLGVSIACFAISLLAGTTLVTQTLGQTPAAWIQIFAQTGTFVLSGLPQMVETICIAASGKIDTHVLMSLAICSTLAMGMAQEGALLLLLFQISHALEEKFTARALGSVEQLFAAIPSQATLVELDEVTGGPLMQAAVQALARSVRPGQHVLVKPGEQVPLDGIVVWGTASVSMQHISGESQPVRVLVGSQLPAGSQNSDGLLVVRVTAGADDSTPARIARMTQAAQATKPKLQRTLDRVGEIWSKAVIGVTLAVLVVLPLMGVPLFAPRGAVYRAMGVLAAGAPCAVVLVPLAYVCAIASITSRGVLVKSGASLDRLHKCHAVALDKTGTITTGSLTLTHTTILDVSTSPCQSIQEIHLPSQQQQQQQEEQQEEEQQGEACTSPLVGTGSSTFSSRDSLSSDILLDDDVVAGGSETSSDTVAMRYCVALCRGSNHPVSKAVVQAAEALLLEDEVQVTMFEQAPGLGVQGLCRLTPSSPLMMVHFGSLDFAQLHLPPGNTLGQLQQAVEDQQRGGLTSKAISFLTVKPFQSGKQAAAESAAAVAAPEESLLAMFCFEDVVAPGAQRAVAALRGGGWRLPPKQVIMLTGDNQQVAQQVAAQVGIDSFHAGLRPEDKLAYITSFGTATSSSSGGSSGGKNGQNGAAREEEGGTRGGSGTSGGSGLLMMGDGINDAPALAAAHVGVAVASTPSDMVAAAADIIILNGQGIANLPWLFQVAYKTQSIIRQNMVLALVSVVCATLPTLAGVFPLWLAVLLHEGATVLVALNSLRLLTDPQASSLHVALMSSLTALKEMFSGDSGHHAHGHSHNHNSHAHGHNHVGASHAHSHDDLHPDHDHEQHGRDHVHGPHDHAHAHGSHDHDHAHGPHDHAHEHADGSCSGHGHAH